MCDLFVKNFAEKVIEKLSSLKLYHVKLPNSVELGYDTYSEFVVAANSEEEARNTPPAISYFHKPQFHEGWILKERVNILIVTEIGYAHPSVKPGVIVASFHSG